METSGLGHTGVFDRTGRRLSGMVQVVGNMGPTLDQVKVERNIKVSEFG